MEEYPELNITYACRSDVGRVRDHNEDYAVVEIPADPEKRRKGRLFIVADGMGGHQAGEVASERAARTTVIEYYASSVGDVPTRLRNAIQAANAEVYRMAQANPDRAGMGTTIVLAAIVGREVHIANVGDSRAYLVRPAPHTITQITTDHSFVGEQVKAGILTREQAKAHPQRNVITRALGSGPTVQVDTYMGTLQEGDAILLCSDGLTEHVPENVLQEIVTRYEPEPAVIRLIELANEGGGSDNISVIVLRAGPAGAPAAPTAPAAAAVADSTPTVPMAQKPGASKTVAAPVSAPRAAPAPPRPAAKGGSSLIWIAGGGIAALLLVAVLAGAIWMASRGLGQATATPTPTAVTPTATATEAVTPSPEISPTSTIAPSATPPPPTRTPRPIIKPAATASLTPDNVTPSTPLPTPEQTATQGSSGGGGSKPTKQPPVITGQPPKPATEKPPDTPSGPATNLPPPGPKP